MSNRRLRLHLSAIGVILFCVGLVLPAAAQDGTSKPGTTIHVVQRDETLFRIATRYGTTVEAIAGANGITDPRYISVGQRLLIPNASGAPAGVVAWHTVLPGQTLATIAQYYAMDVQMLAKANRIANPALLFVGEQLTIPVDDAGPAPGASARRLHVIRPGETVSRIAIRYGMSLADLLRLNHLSPTDPIFAGATLWVTGGDSAAPARDLPWPFLTYDIAPIPAVQGETISLKLSTSQYVTLAGTLMGYPVQIVTLDATKHYALFGIHTFAEPGIYPLVLTATTADGQETTLETRILVASGNYGAETISLTTEQQDLLSPQVTEPEWELFARVMSSFTAQRYFGGVMGLPSTGPISSQFGTRRAYNNGVLNTFHSGTDFAGAPGSPVTAPAAGVVALTENLPVRGNTTIIDHGWGVVTAYFHQAEILVHVGDVVAPGQIIGSVGSTGRSTGPHLHWEMWVGGVQVDPMQWVQQNFP